MSAASAAQPAAALQRSQSASKRSSTYNSHSSTAHRSQSTTSRPSSGAQSSTRPASQRYSYNPPPQSAQPPEHDSQAPKSSRRSSSQDRTNTGPPSRTESSRTPRASSRSGQGRYSTDAPSSAASQANGATAPSSANRRRTTITGQSGTWVLGKTIGAGSMGKVKLAKKPDTGEQVAVKIVPRYTPDDGHHSSKERERQDHSKEIRTAREAAIVSLLDHPYICGMRDVVRTNFHWYMLFEYVNGGQMLDYIISHSRLKEKQARKFGRQIASALDYCHRNSIVHRDLKIENILITKTGDIKIIDFGLSNLFSPRSHLKTFCGSLYFAAPELLQARQYTGPEVDIWSFGIVLYVLVCGKVPFDDQSMPQLHAKIKKGLVDYPNWLSPECKNLISRMLVTDPRNRATLHEIMNHPWLIKNFNGPPENYLPPREALQLPLDPEVIQGMTGFDFGAPEYITGQLTKVIESDEYQAAVRHAKDQHTHSSSADKKRSFPTFEFYKRLNTTSRDTLTNPSAEAVHLGSDPVNAFNPLISIYFLVREKQERARSETSPGALSIPKSPNEKALAVPGVPAPPEAHTNSSSYEMPGESATGGRSQPRARTNGEEDEDNQRRTNNTAPRATSPQADAEPPKKESTAAGLLRRFSTRRHRDPNRARENRTGAPAPPSVSVQPPQDTISTPRKSFSIRRTRDRARDGFAMGNFHAGRSQPAHDELLSPPGTADVRGSKGLGRSASVNSAEHRRRQQRGTSEPRQLLDPPATSGSDRSSINIPKVSTIEPEGKPVTSPKTVATRTMSLGHARRESIQARRARREEAREARVVEETDQELNEEEFRRVPGAENVKPVYLKGLFSVSTTSGKPVAAIRTDIIRVLNQLGVEYDEIRGGFSCKHMPSIDLNKVVDEAPLSPDPAQPYKEPHKRRISFGGFRAGNADRDEFRNREKQRVSKPETSQTNSDMSDESLGRTGNNNNNNNRAVGETTTQVQSELGGSMILHFEVLIVKVSILSLHGIQFKRLAGGTWQYKNMADKILKQLRL
ncbi:MAG: serine/threonine-protein kinase KIN2 [Vezdaea aestivalis]|nr:MAG: serine/threonine-protein kinase KIN2 [Vezdaea aestivalis]